MPDRADHLAKTLLARTHTLERQLAEDHIAPDSPQATERRLSLISKVLATDVGVVNGLIDRTVLRLMPTLRPGREVPESERREFAEALRSKLPLSAES